MSWGTSSISTRLDARSQPPEPLDPNVLLRKLIVAGFAKKAPLEQGAFNFAYVPRCLIARTASGELALGPFRAESVRLESIQAETAQTAELARC